MSVVKHLYVLIHVGTHCTCRSLLPVGVCAHVLDSYMGACMGQWGYTGICIWAVAQIRVCEGVWLQYIYLLSDDIAPMYNDIGQASWKFSWFSRKKFLAL